MSSEIFNEVDETLKVEDETEEPKSKEFRIEGEEVDEEVEMEDDNFYANLAEELEDNILNKISSQLRGEFGSGDYHTIDNIENSCECELVLYTFPRKLKR